MQSEKYCVGDGTTEKNEDRANVDRAHTEMDIMIGKGRIAGCPGYLY